MFTVGFYVRAYELAKQIKATRTRETRNSFFGYAHSCEIISAAFVLQIKSYNYEYVYLLSAVARHRPVAPTQSLKGVFF